ncbi:membrane peptidoglycan carboxypeptidase [Allocatelliglobosispora scoriae]|uniref:Membrane peptidoglycan carboxypeptidase n=1 Tax=Allocatelliglobosispora scoriae TaxID=643052 RepID=A0A841BZ10_9ACTN|nr:transglycosylase domain-containing protein [Allocatelliglobosispora scoriae]MBB5872153.1 membrane peptidoglycan carboxypeptidase [Allocatelliglobosispora scoriae]
MIKRTLAAAGRLTPLLRAGLISGVVVAAVTYPLAAVGGLGVKAGVDYYQSLPSDLNIVPPSQTTYVYANDGKTLMTMFYEEHRKYTPMPEISENIVNAIVASEDARFYEHNGVDTKGIVRAFVANHSAGEVSQGASTLTMQYVRASLRDSAQTPAEVMQATEQTSARKLREMRMAIALEKQISKRDILERYLNVAYFGHRAYGIFAASQIFFSKLPKDLTVTEAATLAGLVKAPSAYDPAASDPRAATERRNYVIDKMKELGYITAADADKAKVLPIKLKITVPPNDCISVPKAYNSWGFFCDYLKSWWASQPAFGNSAAEREDKLRRGGYRIVTSLDPRIQKIAQRNVNNQVSAYSSFGHGIVLVQPGTGMVKAMGVNRVYSLDQKNNGEHSDPARQGKIRGNYPNTVNPLLGGGDLPGYQAGSTFKLFTAVAALSAGYPLSTSFYSPQRLTSQYWTGWDDPKSCAGGHWCPSNASGAMTGTQNMWSGFGKSVNTYFVQLEQKVGADQVVKMAENLGLRWRSDVDQMMAKYPRSKEWGAFTLGVSDVSPLEMANAYATMAADGKYCETIPVQSITTPEGKAAMWTPPGGAPVEIAKPRCRQAVSVQVARGFTDIARCVTGYGAAKGGCGSWSTAPSMYSWTERPIAGKTGTTDDTRAAWFVGYTPELAAASFMSDPDNPFHVVGDWNYNVPLFSVAYTLRDALAGQPKRSFTPPSGPILGNNRTAMVPRSATQSTPRKSVKPKVKVVKPKKKTR